MRQIPQCPCYLEQTRRVLVDLSVWFCGRAIVLCAAEGKHSWLTSNEGVIRHTHSTDFISLFHGNLPGYISAMALSHALVKLRESIVVPAQKVILNVPQLE